MIRPYTLRAADAPELKQVGTIGDENFPEYSGGPVYCRLPKEGGQTDIWGDCFVEYVEPPEEDFDKPGAIWTVYRVDLDPGVPNFGNIEDIASTTGQDPEELEAAFNSNDPMERAYAYESLAGHFGWFELDQYPLTLTRLEVEKRYDADLGGASGITTAIEETVQRMADESNAMAWSTPNDQMLIDLESEGFDPSTVVDIADFGDAVAVNGDLTDEAVVAIMKKLEADGYEETNKGGRIPTEEAEVSADHVVRAVAKELDHSEEDVREAAKSLDWWQENIPWSSSGDGSVWAKRAAAGAEEPRRRHPMARAAGREVAGEYHTRTGKIGAIIYRHPSARGTTYSYTGEWGAGSGHDAAYMKREIRDWFERKRGIQTITAFVP